MHGSGRHPAPGTGGDTSRSTGLVNGWEFLTEGDRDLEAAAAFLASPGAPAADREPYGDGYGPEFTASYDGECGECFEPLYEGDLIRADGDGGYVHSECAGD